MGERYEKTPFSARFYGKKTENMSTTNVVKVKKMWKNRYSMDRIWQNGDKPLLASPEKQAETAFTEWINSQKTVASAVHSAVDNRFV